MNIYFRVDASSTIGFGHFMRCLTLAKALRDRGGICRFVTREHEGSIFAAGIAAGFETFTLPLTETSTDPDRGQYAAWIGASWEMDARQTCEVIGENNADWIIVDHYGLDYRWEHAVRSSCRRLMVIDDLADRRHDCDLLLDQNLVADLTTRYDNLAPDHCGLMLGAAFALLQTDYAALRDRVPSREGTVERVLIYFGGADRHNLTGTSVRALLDLASNMPAIDVVIGANSPSLQDLNDLARRWPSVVIHENLTSLAALMVKADLAIGAAGTTSWERCCLGLPTLLITMADNQKPIAAELDRRQLARWIGDVSTVTSACITTAVHEVLNQGALEDWSRRAAQAVDGQGTSRVCAYLMLDSRTVLTARYARVDDELLVLEWANDPQSRRNAFSTSPISAETHHHWFRSRLRDLDNCIFLIVTEPGGVPIGQVRFDLRGQGWEISYMLDSRSRGRGLGASLLKAALDRLGVLRPSASCFGRVKSDNAASRRVFERLGFDCEANADVLTYRLQLSRANPDV